MPRRTWSDDPDEDEGDWDESDDYDAERDYDPDDPETYPAGVYTDPEPAMVPCPYCRAEIDEDAVRCPRCENYMSKEDAPGAAVSWPWAVLMVLALLAALFWAVAGS